MGATKAANTLSGGLPAPARPTRLDAEPQTQRRCRKAAWRVNLQSRSPRSPSIPPTLEPASPDPEGTLQQLGLVQPREFWQWYHAEDGPPGPREAHMGAKWGEFWTEFLLSDPLVLAGAVPLVLHKRAQMTGVRDERGVRLAEFQALRKLRERLECLDDGVAVGGLVVAICGRVNVNIQHGEPELALMHLRAIARLAGMQQFTGTAWICAAFTDLRTVSPTQLAPLLHRLVPSDWQTCASPLPPDGMQACQRSAMSNMRSLAHVGSANFNLMYSIFKQLHELDAMAVSSAEQPIEMLYHTIYDCCVLDSSSCAMQHEDRLATQAQLLNICVKLCVWERASRYVPRGGEIERSLLRRARQLLDGESVGLRHITKFPGGANSSAMLWMMFCLTATSYMFERGEMGTWIERLRAFAPVTTASGLQRALKGWPLAPWWLTHALRRICNDLAPKKGQWQVVSVEPEPVPTFSTGLRLKLLVIGS